jgi:hypothetical protein
MLEKVAAWLEEQGYPLEMRTAAEFRKAGFEVTQSVLYKDRDTEKYRETDVFALDPDLVGVTQIAFVVECKAVKKPWLLLCGPDVLVGHNVVRSFAAVSDTVVNALSEADQIIRLQRECPWFRGDDLTGYSLRSAFSDKDIAYETALSVAKATNDFLRTKQEKGYTTFVTVFPVIVLDAPLIRCSLANDGRIELCSAPCWNWTRGLDKVEASAEEARWDARHGYRGHLKRSGRSCWKV